MAAYPGLVTSPFLGVCVPDRWPNAGGRCSPLDKTFEEFWQFVTLFSYMATSRVPVAVGFALYFYSFSVAALTGALHNIIL